ncbi:S1 family peptidase [Leifsonia sp. McL0607]|uniref:S1 family peptidase n=1 Tax=Leifsonia sp. McL0607 TaxID=3415672 RepID=UPI003CEC0099
MSTGFVAALGTDRSSLLGSCAIFQQRHILLTAAHCIPDDTALELVAVLPGDVGARRIREVVLHPAADLAVAFLEPQDPEPLAPQVFTDVDSTLTEGGDFYAFGYPVEGTGKPVGRFFKGHFQRYFEYEDSSGRNYFAGELSIPAPGGLSGGPVSAAHSPNRLAAIVTANVESYVIVDSVSEVDDDGKQYREESRRVISYGIAAMLTGHGPWIRSVIDTEVAAGDGGGFPLRREVPLPS